MSKIEPVLSPIYPQTAEPLPLWLRTVGYIVGFAVSLAFFVAITYTVWKHWHG